ncbi:hypothetical protein ACHOLT_10330 [Desulfitobacterium sp. Sab5]|uniref:hypothetical protein n=1 Tax=Desulfitobacterium nosdiversum TaxID=3375356 RepID=UPI003CF20331
MFFLKKKTNSSIEPSSESTSLNQNLPEPKEPSALLESSAVSSELEAPYENSTLFHRFSRNQKFYSGPELSYEDEAWAPEFQSVRLFHKKWSTAEEQISSPSDSQ